MSADAGIVLGLLTAAAVVCVAVIVRDLLVLAVGALATLQVISAAIVRWFPDEAAASLALLVVGAVLVAAAIRTARRAGGGPSTHATRDPVAHRFAAMTAAGAVIVAVTAFVLVVALA